jgi:hypothetical protein
LLDYFWLICGVWVGLGSFIIGKAKSRSLVESGEYSKEEADLYLKVFAGSVFIPSLVFWILQMSVGPDAGIDFVSWPNPQKLIALVVLCFLWTYLLIWTLFLGGARPLGRCLGLIGNFPEFMLSPAAVKVLVIILVAGGFASFFVRH